jgi:hypothetical protein
VQVAQTRFGASSVLNINVVGACANFVLKKLLQDDTMPERLPTLNARTMEVAALLLWSSSSELVMSAEVWAHSSGGRLHCKSRLTKIFGKRLPSGPCSNSRLTNVRMDSSTMQKLCTAVRTIYWVSNLLMPYLTAKVEILPFLPACSIILLLVTTGGMNLVLVFSLL